MRRELSCTESRFQNRGNKGVRPGCQDTLDSTIVICIRALHPREFIDKWIDLSDSIKINGLRLSNVVALLYPFYRCIQAVSTRYIRWRVYNGLFEHLESDWRTEKETVKALTMLRNLGRHPT